MGYMMVIGPCFGCGRTFSFHPDRVPSITINGIREPICLNCVERANPIRVQNGLDPIRILPGAYEPEEVA